MPVSQPANSTNIRQSSNGGFPTVIVSAAVSTGSVILLVLVVIVVCCRRRRSDKLTVAQRYRVNVYPLAGIKVVINLVIDWFMFSNEMRHGTARKKVLVR